MLTSPENSTQPTSRARTIQDLADKLGIHKSTVSVAFSGKGRISDSMREKILSMALEMGYEPDPVAQRLANRSKSNMVCLCSGAFGDRIWSDKISFLQNYISIMGYEVPIYTPPKAAHNQAEVQATLFRNLRRQRPLAIVLAVYSLHEAAFVELEQYQKEGGIVISYDLPVPLDCDHIIFDREDNAYQGARYLLEQGHRHIGIGMSRVKGSPTDPRNMTQVLRLQGFRRALSEYGEAMHNEWLFANVSMERGGGEMARHFLELKERPTGLCIVNDYVALACMVELMRAGVKLPEEVSMIGHDNQPIASFCPIPLTCVSQPSEDIVDAVVKQLGVRLSGDTQPPQTITIRGQIIERQSVTAPMN